MRIAEVRKIIDDRKGRSAWARGVHQYALELLDELEELNPNSDGHIYGSPADHKAILNGAEDWQRYSEACCYLVQVEDIARRLCSPSVFAKTKEGRYRPSSRQQWLDVQARALRAANRIIWQIVERRSNE